MNTRIVLNTVLALLCAAGLAAAQDTLVVELKAARQMVLAHQSVDMTLTVSNKGAKPVAALTRAQLVAAKSVVVASQADGPERKGAWAELVGKTPEGSLPSLQPGESFTIPFVVRLPEAATRMPGMCTLQWVGRGGALEKVRSNEVHLNLLPGDKPMVTLTTGEGVITIELWPDKAPNHVANFLTLAQAGFYDNTGFHRTVPGFMIQGGCPEGDGSGGPGYSIPDGETDVPFARGVLGFGRTSKPNSAGSQFFICVAEAAHLNGKYAAFGRVLDGIEVADRIVMQPTEGDRALKPVKITRVSVDLPKGYELPAVKKA